MATAGPPVAGRRERIVVAAGSVLGREGYARTSMKQIAQEAGVAPGLLHYYFQSKEDLLLEVVASLDAQFSAEWRAATAGIADPLERIARGVDRAAATCGGRPEFFRMLIDLYVLGLANPAIRERTQLLVGRFVGELTEEVRSIAGSLPTPLPIPEEDLAHFIASSVDGIALISLVLGRDPEGCYRALKLVLLGLASVAYTMAGQPPPLERLAQLALSPHVPERTDGA